MIVCELIQTQPNLVSPNVYVQEEQCCLGFVRLDWTLIYHVATQQTIKGSGSKKKNVAYFA